MPEGNEDYLERQERERYPHDWQGMLDRLTRTIQNADRDNKFHMWLIGFVMLATIALVFIPTSLIPADISKTIVYIVDTAIGIVLAYTGKKTLDAKKAHDAREARLQEEREELLQWLFENIYNWDYKTFRTPFPIRNYIHNKSFGSSISFIFCKINGKTLFPHTELDNKVVRLIASRSPV